MSCLKRRHCASPLFYWFCVGNSLSMENKFRSRKNIPRQENLSSFFFFLLLGGMGVVGGILVGSNCTGVPGWPVVTVRILHLDSCFPLCSSFLPTMKPTQIQLKFSMRSVCHPAMLHTLPHQWATVEPMYGGRWGGSKLGPRHLDPNGHFTFRPLHIPPMGTCLQDRCSTFVCSCVRWH